MRQRMQLIGLEISEGVSKKSGQAYAVGTVHTMTELAPALGDNIAKGFSGDKFSADVGLLRTVAHLSFPLVAEVEIQNQIRYGNREQVITGIFPVEVKKAAA